MSLSAVIPPENNIPEGNLKVESSSADGAPAITATPMVITFTKSSKRKNGGDHKCEEHGCGYSTSKKINLKVHMRIHTGDFHI